MKNEKADKLFAQLTLNAAHLDYINEHIEEIYDTIYEQTEPISEYEEDTLYFLQIEKQKTEEIMKELKKDYKEALLEASDSCTGKIEIEYKNLPDEVRFQLYRYLNKIYFDYPAEFGYKTVENTTKYSKDFANTEGES